MWWENEPLQSISKSGEQTQKRRKIASPQKTAHILVSQMEWHEPFDFQVKFPVFSFKC